jgi:hypothetical protein
VTDEAARSRDGQNDESGDRLSQIAPGEQSFQLLPGLHNFSLRFLDSGLNQLFADVSFEQFVTFRVDGFQSDFLIDQFLDPIYDLTRFGLHGLSIFYGPRRRGSQRFT